MSAGNSVPSLNTVAEECWKQLEAHVASCETPDISDELMLSFHHVYGKNWENALRILDEGRVVCYVGEKSGRRVHQIQPGASSKKAQEQHQPYIVFPHLFCSCPAHYNLVVHKQEALCCKHQLAARLSTLLRRTTELKVPDLAIAQLLMHA